MAARLLILGGTGMLGHKAWQMFNASHDTYVTIRGPFCDYEHYGIFDRKRTIENIDVSESRNIESVVKRVSPTVIVNCIGFVKQLAEKHQHLKSIEINALFPHKLAQVCEGNNIRIIHISTDCVFSGKKGYYNENDFPDVDDLYGRTKFLGEVAYWNVLTIRTSMIGHELSSQKGLLEWFLSQEGRKIKGYTKAIFSGFTTKVMCEILRDIIDNHPHLRGIYHVSSNPIDKFTLLTLLKEMYNVDIEIEPYDEFICDRSLDSTRFRREANFTPPSWKEMAIDMYNDFAFYKTLSKCK